MEKDIKDSKSITHRITDLTVKVPKKYEDNLDQKWQFKSWEYMHILSALTNKKTSYWIPTISCNLCIDYKGFSTVREACPGCPFRKFGDDNNAGCIAWIKLFAPEYKETRISPEEFKAMVNKLRRKAKENIIFY